ncbi:MAG TPA: plastocyanin/azurin family copper-binding protein [Solirubrobacteraceae bacterium]|jgi:plastocyanin|nr:plastocyanin/azurin family copper-binding protein [Solirubrobacteraceae bacterium]
MHHLAMQLAPVLAAEKSKVPFYIAGGLLVAWALFVSLALGMRRPDFPGNEAGQRAVMAISAVLVIAAVVSAVLTSGAAPEAKATIPPLPVAPNPSVPAVGTSASTPASSTQASTSPAPSAQGGGTPSTAAAPKAAAPKAAAPTSLKLAADAGGLLSFDAKQLSAKAGTVTITFTNSSPIEHNVAFAQGSAVIESTPTFRGGSKSLTLNVKAGTYTFFCTVPGHRQGGMEGTLKVAA